MVTRGLIVWPLALVLLLLIFRWLSLSLNKGSTAPPELIDLKVGDSTIKTQVAQSAQEKERGLSGRESLAEDEGLLFVFDRPGFYPFWMKDMNFPIDIIWIGGDKKIVDLSENITPETFPQTFVSKVPARYVLEVNAGWVLKKMVQVGQAVAFD